MNLNSRKRRRDNYGYKGEGTSSGWKKTTFYGDYKSSKYNNKRNDIKNAIAKKSKVGFRPDKYGFGHINSAGMTKNYADNHQKITH